MEFITYAVVGMIGMFVGMLVMGMLSVAGESDRRTSEIYESELKKQELL
tara:strand:+ start:43478 stop:43624 length:147 start_codon:yes stop_codon:yes gene_type:complete